MKNKYIAFNTFEGEFEFCKTEDEAKKVINDYIFDCDGEFDEEIQNGGIGYAKIIAKTKFVISDKISNYKNKDDWPHDKDYNDVGKLKLRKVK